MRCDYNWCNYLVASVDVLGQKEAFKDMQAIPTDEESKKKFRKAHEKTVLFIEAFRVGFRNYFDMYSEDSESIVKVPEEKRGKFEEIRKSLTIKYQFFSDSMLASIPLQTEKYQSNAINGVYGILGACGGMLLLSLSEKKAFRVGIDVGPGTELKDGDIYGPALVRAYKLESEVAKYPRIVIGSEFLNYLLNLSHKTEQFPGQDEEDKEICKNMADLCLSMIVKDLDGVLILDYLGEEFRNKILKKIDSAKEIFGKAYDFVKKEYEQKRESGERKLALRYYLLHNYFRAKSSVGEENMYRSKNLIGEKIRQLKYVYFNRIKRYEGKVFVHGGRDPKTGCHPLDVDVGNFITIGRNIFQYALEEIGTQTEFRRLYDSYLEGRPLLKYFKGLRDSEIHIGPGGHQTIISATSRFRREKKNGEKPFPEHEDVKSEPVVITYEMSKILVPSAELYSQYQEEGNSEFVEAIEKGIPIYKKTEFEAETDLFKLCEKYIEEIELFLKYGLEKGFIT
jgi:hypothetical protein